MNSTWEKLEKIIGNYIGAVRSELAARWRQWRLDLTKPELHEVVGALVARQVTFATQIARSPGIWNPHIAPLLLRSMTDAYITLAWILKNQVERSQKFVLHGLGQQKLTLEHRKASLAAEGRDPAEDPEVKAYEAWLNAQRFDFLTEVNIGSWSDMPVRDMAEEADCLDLYRYAYIPFSATTHNMWHHISRLNLQVCENPLHRYHKVPVDPDFDPDPDYLYRAAKYVEKSFRLFDQTFSIQSGMQSAFGQLTDDLTSLGSTQSPREGDLEGK